MTGLMRYNSVMPDNCSPAAGAIESSDLFLGSVDISFCPHLNPSSDGAGLQKWTKTVFLPFALSEKGG